MKKYLLLSFLALASFASASAQTPVVTGYIQNWLSIEERQHKAATTVGATTTPETPNDLMYGFRLRRAVFGAKSEINETFSMAALVDFAVNDKLGLDFFFTAKIAPTLYFKVGQFVPSIQVWEGSRSSSDLKFYEYADMSMKVANYMNLDGYRDMGVQIGGTYDIFDYSAFVGNGLGRYTFISGLKERQVGDGIYGVRLDVRPVKGLRIGGHFAINKQDSINYADKYMNMDRNSYSIGFESQNLILPGLILQGDFTGGKVNDFARLVPGNYTSYGATRSFTFNGASAVLGYKVTRNLHILGRYDFFNESYDALKTDTVKREDLKLSKINVGATYYFFNEDKEIFKVGINYHIKNEKPDTYLSEDGQKSSKFKVDDNVFCIFTQIKF